jgi:lipopolysaccharide transport system permease protein
VKQASVTINPHAAQPISPASLAASLWRNRQLLAQMTRREVVGRYKGSALGLAWSFFNPVFMLVVYTFVFSEIFRSRWSGLGGDESKTQFALVLFVGMIVLGLFSEVVNRAPGLILANANYVKKVVFPLEVLPVVNLGAALFHSLISLAVLLAAYALFNGALQWTAVFVPLVLLPLLILILGLAWMLASLGVFLRDVGQFVAILTTVAGVLSRHCGSGALPLDHYAQSTDFHHRTGARRADLGPLAGLARARGVYGRRHGVRLVRLCVVPENPERIRRCPLTLRWANRPSASKISANATKSTTPRATA